MIRRSNGGGYDNCDLVGSAVREVGDRQDERTYKKVSLLSDLDSEMDDVIGDEGRELYIIW